MEINNRQGFTYKSWLLLAPLSCATLVAVSRTMDYRHHATDVIAGSVIGLLGGWYAYRQYYPVRSLFLLFPFPERSLIPRLSAHRSPPEQPLSHPVAYKPYSPRIPKSDPSPIPLHSHSHSRPSTEAMLRQHEFQPSQAQFQFGRESSASPVETLGERRAGGGYGPDGPVGIVDMNGWNRQPYQPQQTQQTPTTIKDLEIQSDR